MSYGSSTIGSALNWRAFSLAAMAAGFALSAAACDGRHPAAPATDVLVLNIYNWADYVGYNTIAEFERRTHIKT
jgi:spermidine/putrescine-binding protein